MNISIVHSTLCCVHGVYTQEDSRKLNSKDRQSDKGVLLREDIRRCVHKLQAIDVNQMVDVASGIHVRVFPSGHVLGGAVFHVDANGESVVYTGSMSMSSDRHLAATRMPRLVPDLLITESPSCSTSTQLPICESRHDREQSFVRIVVDAVTAGGKVLIPCDALSVAQELALVLEAHWERVGSGFASSVPIYVSSNLSQKVNTLCKLVPSWTRSASAHDARRSSAFDFRYIHSFDASMLDLPGPCVLLAAPSMLTSGLSLEAFIMWANEPKNVVLLPESATANGSSIGSRLVSGHRGRLDVSQRKSVDVQCGVRQLKMCTTRGADARSIVQLLWQCAPRHVMFVDSSDGQHDNDKELNKLMTHITQNMGIGCSCPPNGIKTNIETGGDVGVAVEISSDTILDTPGGRGSDAQLHQSLGGAAHSGQDFSSTAARAVQGTYISNVCMCMCTSLSLSLSVDHNAKDILRGDVVHTKQRE